MKLTKIFGIVLSLHVAVILLVMFQPGCQTVPGTGQDHNQSAQQPASPTGFNSGLEENAPEGPLVTGTGERSPPTAPQPGELLVPTEPGVDSTPAGGLRPSDVTVYSVQKGDSLWSIARKNNLTVDRLLSANDIAKDATLSIGQEIFLPVTGDPGAETLLTPDKPKPVSTGTEVHMVRSGDTLSGIARTYGVSINAIKDANNLRTDVIQIGQRLLVPSIGSSTPAPVPEDPAPTVPSGQVTHVIKAGETLTSIALQYGVSSQMLADMNKIVNPNALKIGQALIVNPAPIVEDATPADDGNNADSLEEIFRNAGEAPVVPLLPRNE